MRLSNANLPLIIGLLIIILTSSVWYAEYVSDLNRLHDEESNFINESNTRIISLLSDQIELVNDVLIKQWYQITEVSDLTNQTRFNKIIPKFFDFFPNYLAINWVNSSGNLVFAYPFSYSEEFIGKSLNYSVDGTLNLILQNTMKSREIHTSDYIQFHQGDSGIESYLPIVYDDQLIGLFNVLVDIDLIFSTYFTQEDVNIDYRVEIKNNVTTIFQRGEEIDYDVHYSTRYLRFLDLEWILTVQFSSKVLSNYNLINNIYILISGLFLSVLSVINSRLIVRQNILRQKKMEADGELQILINRYDKMNALGRLAGGVSHDFNNILMAIQANLDLLANSLERGMSSEVNELIRSIGSIIDSAVDLTRQILIFSRQDDLESNIVDIHAVLQDTLSIFENIADRRINLIVNYFHDQSLARLNQSRLSQCFMNVLNNAVDAISQTTGFIEINTFNVSQKELPIMTKDLHANRVGNRFFKVEFIDSGFGIEKVNLDLIFDPFFTTKEIGKGTGLGLSQVYQYIASLGGHVAVRSTPGVGTKIILFIPLSLNEVEENLPSQERSANQIPSRTSASYDLNILLVEDEDAIRKAIQDNLTLENYHVQGTDNGVDGLDLYYQSTFNIVILDINMPQMNGIEVARRILQTNPEQKLIFITGFSEIPLSKDIRAHVEILQKPFSIQLLISTIHRILENE